MVIRSPIETAISGFLIVVLTLAPVWIYHEVEFMVHIVDPWFALTVSAIAVAFLSWFTLSLLGGDRAEYFLLWLIIPIVLIFIVRVFVFPEWAAGPYPINEHPFAIMIGGFLGIALEFIGINVAKEFDSYLEPVVRHKAILIVILLLIPIGLVGISYATPDEASINSVDPVFGCSGEYPDRIDGGTCPLGLSHGFAVNVEPDGDALRMTVETPSGSVNEAWFTGDEMDRDSATVFLLAHTIVVEPPEVGTYTITIENKWGDTLDQTTFEIENLSAASITDVTVVDAEAGLVDITAEYEGDFRIEMSPLLHYDSETQIEFHENFFFDGPGTDTVRATVVDDDDNPLSLEPGEYTIDVMFDRIGDRSIHTFTVED